jgi:hypothetical protein
VLLILSLSQRELNKLIAGQLLESSPLCATHRKLEGGGNPLRLSRRKELSGDGRNARRLGRGRMELRR